MRGSVLFDKRAVACPRYSLLQHNYIHISGGTPRPARPNLGNMDAEEVIPPASRPSLRVCVCVCGQLCGIVVGSHLSVSEARRSLPHFSKYGERLTAWLNKGRGREDLQAIARAVHDIYQYTKLKRFTELRRPQRTKG